MVFDVIQKCMEYFPELHYLNEQLPFLVEKEIIYTGAGVIIYFDFSIISYKPIHKINAVYEGPIILSEAIPEGADSSCQLLMVL